MKNESRIEAGFGKNRIEIRLDELKRSNKKAFIPFVMTGDPDLDTTFHIVMEMIGKGASIIELGVPFSDPSAEGPVIMRANDRALQKGVRLKDVMDLVKRIRNLDEDTPIVLLIYFNCIFCYGPERFFADCFKAGADGVIIPDLPYEERGEIQPIADGHNIINISMVSPTSKERAKKIAEGARGFLYCVSSLGVTGERTGFSTNFEEFFARLNSYSSIPKAIGFGVSTPQQASELKKYCDGIIVGSAIVRQIEEGIKKGCSCSEIVKTIGNYTGLMRKALDEEERK